MSEAIKTYLAEKDKDPSARISSPEFTLSKKSVANLPIQPYDYQVRVKGRVGLRVRVRKTGSKLLEYSVKVDGKTVTPTVCLLDDGSVYVGPKGVLKDAETTKAELMVGVTPTAKRAQKRVQTASEARMGLTVGDACTNYIDAKKNRAESTRRNYENHRDVKLADWLNLPLVEITEDMAANLHDDLTVHYGPVAANNCLRFFRAVWRHHRRRLGLGDCPTIIFTDEGDNVREWHPEERRERFVSSEELKDWWNATERLRDEYAGDGDLAADYLQFAMLTGLRRREVSSIEQADINRRRKTILIPDNKSKRPYSIPMTDPLKEILDRRKDEVRPFAVEEPKRFIAQVSEWCKVDFSTHDLRRSFLSHATAAGIPLPVQKALVNHSRKGDVTDGYIQISDKVLRDAMDKVQQYILLHAGQISNVRSIGNVGAVQ
jgi:integrase